MLSGGDRLPQGLDQRRRSWALAAPLAKNGYGQYLLGCCEDGQRRMKVLDTDLPGCMFIEPQVFGDARGVFFELERAALRTGMDLTLCRATYRRSVAACFGACTTSGRNPQGKLVSVLEGEV